MQPLTLTVASGVLAFGTAATWRWRLEPSERMDLTPMHLLSQPEVDDAPGPEEARCWSPPNTPSNWIGGRIVPDDSQAGRLRRRDAATQWGLFRSR
jgi:hypothetical protein